MIDMFQVYASICKKKKHEYCINKSIHSQMKKKKKLSSLPTPFEFELNEKKKTLSLDPEILHNTNSKKKKQLTTVAPVITMTQKKKKNHILAGSLNCAYFFQKKKKYFDINNCEQIDVNKKKKEENADHNYQINKDEKKKKNQAFQNECQIINIQKKKTFCRCTSFHPCDLLKKKKAYNNIFLYDFMKSEKKKKISTHKSSITGICFSPDGSHMISGSYDCTIKTQDLIKSQSIYDINIKEKIKKKKSTNDGSLVGSTTDKKKKILFDDRQEGSTVKIAAHKNWASSLAFSNNLCEKKKKATSGSDKSIALFDKKKKISSMYRLYRHNGTPLSIAFDNIGHIWSASEAGELQAWNINNAQNVYKNTRFNTLFSIEATETAMIVSSHPCSIARIELNSDIFESKSPELFNFEI
ncbi:hypothetical protein TRFO_38479 [Tritrichomonas foetus]|uniref:Uncharacterized protein n=1 Tax=Tritrichomonas foetus TaxID=1144522 RepID=A0A1J4JDD5_9EUKA|nr:hypothetical protein TRFO_38479 [Tritrichomonas foetus]|eukprot:OHS95445.1 hypothetical protein TRFO_38479 [Tritrichomonas foetus]